MHSTLVQQRRPKTKEHPDSVRHTQSGVNPEILYREIAEYIRLRNINKMIGIGKQISIFSDAFQVKEKHFFPDTEEFLLHFHESDFRDEVILLKGARSFRFDRISTLLQEKAPNIMEINLSAMVHNLNHYRGQLRPETKLMAWLKPSPTEPARWKLQNSSVSQGRPRRGHCRRRN